MKPLTTAAQAAARDHAAIAAGVPSFALMQQAAAVSAALILREYGDRLVDGVAVFAGSGNNGGDAYLVAAQLARAGVLVRLHASALPGTHDAQHAANLATRSLSHGEPTGRERVVVDGVLGTGHRGALREHAAASCLRMAQLRASGAVVVALDVPSGLDASTGEAAVGAVAADVTVSFGTLKRGHLMRRDLVGRLVLADIGLDEFHGGPNDDAADNAVDERIVDREAVRDVAGDGAWSWADHDAIARRIPHLAWNAHKGTRGRVGLIGGDAGMAGALVLATRAALAAGAGVAHAIVHEASVGTLQALVPQAITHRWPPLLAARRTDAAGAPLEAPAYDAIAVGPGLGRTRESAQLVERLLQNYREMPIVLDADALWLAADAATSLGTDAASLLRHWTRDATQVVCTPHPGEFARLIGRPLPDTWDDRAALLAEFSLRSKTTVLLKGTPTLVAHDDAPLVAVPYGTPLLATGGSGDCLTGIIATFLAQGARAADAAIAGAAVHGLAAEAATALTGQVRGPTLDAVLAQMPTVFASLTSACPTAPGVLAELPSVDGDRRRVRGRAPQ
jgi:NAD(P)H-hydrate epimerase